MIEFKVRTSRSWLDYVYSKVMAAKFADRLVARCEGEEGRFVTLTYRREEYEGPMELYRAAIEERHVRRFISRLARMLGPLCGQRDSRGRWTLTGKWCRKMEFQEGGWVHWHLVVLVPWIENREHELTNCWGHGYAWVTPVEESELRYVAKYVAKDGVLPTWLYMERIRSVRIVAASPGFWDDIEDVEEDREDREEWSTRLDGAFVTIGEQIERSEQRLQVRDGEGKYHQMTISTYDLFQHLEGLGYRASSEGEGGWLRFEGLTLSSLIDAVSGWGRRRQSRPAPLHSINNTHPPFCRKWLDRWFEYWSRPEDDAAGVRISVNTRGLEENTVQPVDMAC